MNNLPKDVLRLIFNMLPGYSKYLGKTVCKHWHKLIVFTEKIPTAGFAESLSLIKYAHDLSIPKNLEMISNASLLGNLSVLQFCKENGYFNMENSILDRLLSSNFTLEGLDPPKPRDKTLDIPLIVYSAAAINGSIDILEWAKPLFGEEQFKKISPIIFLYAVMAGNVNVLDWFTELQPDKNMLIVAARNGQRDVLEWALKRGLKLSEKVFAEAAEHGDLSFMEYLRKKACPWDVSLCSRAANIGNLHVLKWAHSHGAPWDSGTLAGAYAHDHMDTFNWLKENGCPYNEALCKRRRARATESFDIKISNKNGKVFYISPLALM